MCVPMITGCLPGGTIDRDDLEALSIGMSVIDAEDAIGSEMVVESEQQLMGGTVAIGYFGDLDGAHIAIVAFDGEITRIEPVGL